MCSHQCVPTSELIHSIRNLLFVQQKYSLHDNIIDSTRTPLLYNYCVDGYFYSLRTGCHFDYSYFVFFSVPHPPQAGATQQGRQRRKRNTWNPPSPSFPSPLTSSLSCLAVSKQSCSSPLLWLGQVSVWGLVSMACMHLCCGQLLFMKVQFKVKCVFIAFLLECFVMLPP